MASGVAVQRKFDIGRVFSRTGGALRRNAIPMLAIALVLGGIPTFAMNWFARDAEAIRWAVDWTGGLGIGIATLVMIATLVSMAAGVAITGILILMTFDDARGKAPNINACVADGLRMALPLIALGILSGLGVGLGLLLFIVPGVLLYLRWAVAGDDGGTFGHFRQSVAQQRADTRCARIHFWAHRDSGAGGDGLGIRDIHLQGRDGRL